MGLAQSNLLSYLYFAEQASLLKGNILHEPSVVA